METAESRLSLSATLQALNGALRGKTGEGTPLRGSVWFKESSAQNLRSRDFLAPQAALRGMFANGKVPHGIAESVLSIKSPGVPPIQSCQEGSAGLTVQLERPAAFEKILTAIPTYTKPQQRGGGHSILLNCVPLHGRRGLASLSLSHLRAILVADHLAGLLHAQGVDVHLVPALQDEESHHFLRQLRVEWPSVLETSPNLEDILAMKEALRRCPYATFAPTDQDGVVCKLHLKGILKEQEHLEGYDSNLDVFLVTEEKLCHVAELHRVVLRCTADAPGRSCSVVHVVSHEEAFQQQKVDLLWRLVALQTLPGPQKHLVCGPVKTIRSASPLSSLHYFQLRHSQMYEASVLKYGDLSQDDTWTEIVNVLTAAAIRFEMLSINHQSQVLLDVEEASISTKGTKSGAFVMYNCARLATLFETYKRAEEQGLYPAFPPPSELNYISLREEETLDRVIQLSLSDGGLRITANTEAVCKFLIQLSMDFSSYYNRVHILGEPRPHLFSQMFARLQLMRAVREVFHSALATLHLPPLCQI
nr:PREDICTED: DALR anticodon-binding domain-containing protein 3 [Anolis carolinensis]|eukprot:XP_008103648.1 PREDICTED: DALR anticodon-binding domain-containing protein 3 [Anolis carolinensis]